MCVWDSALTPRLAACDREESKFQGCPQEWAMTPKMRMSGMRRPAAKKYLPHAKGPARKFLWLGLICSSMRNFLAGIIRRGCVPDVPPKWKGGARSEVWLRRRGHSLEYEGCPRYAAMRQHIR